MKTSMMVRNAELLLCVAALGALLAGGAAQEEDREFQSPYCVLTVLCCRAVCYSVLQWGKYGYLEY